LPAARIPLPRRLESKEDVSRRAVITGLRAAGDLLAVAGATTTALHVLILWTVRSTRRARNATVHGASTVAEEPR
jgi:hypothetical protein